MNRKPGQTTPNQTGEGFPNSYQPSEHHFQQQFPRQQYQQHSQQHPSYPTVAANNFGMPMMNYQPNTMQMTPRTAPATVHSETQPSYGTGQYFVDAGCTVPVGQLQQQPQPLQQYPHVATAATRMPSSGRACTNPGCQHCCNSKPTTVVAPNQRR
ncbi:uncharacterized protein LOC129729475 [Wyeomyia smithii]|uniref:uncharacterized protein LOC129729475 n=1 Tax=Wyeomyia smithii TaxID=174621 RepID=UPI002467F7AC|nr:uncharacterized protein LOC129729475 [Wyeomyia smithii]